MAIKVPIYLGMGNHGCSKEIVVEFQDTTSTHGVVVKATACVHQGTCCNTPEEAEEWENNWVGKHIKLESEADAFETRMKAWARLHMEKFPEHHAPQPTWEVV